MGTEIYHINGIGDVKFTRRKGSQKVTMRVKPDGIVSVNYPWFTSKKELLNFIIDNSHWIAERKKKISSSKIAFAYGDEIKTLLRSIRIEKTESGRLRGIVRQDEVAILVPINSNIENETTQKFIAKVIVEVCRNDAKKYLPRRVATLANMHSLKYNKVYIKNLKSKWGSCSSMLNINLSLHLMRLPTHLIDYIILHELAHTVELNHSDRFWDFLNKLTNGRAKTLNKEMKMYRDIVRS